MHALLQAPHSSRPALLLAYGVACLAANMRAHAGHATTNSACLIESAQASTVWAKPRAVHLQQAFSLTPQVAARHDPPLQRRPGQQHCARPVQGPHPARSSQPRRPGPRQSRPRRRRSSRRRWRRCRRARPACARRRRARPAGRGWRCGSPPAARPRCQSLRPRTGPWLTTA